MQFTCKDAASGRLFKEHPVYKRGFQCILNYSTESLLKNMLKLIDVNLSAKINQFNK